VDLIAAAQVVQSAAHPFGDAAAVLGHSRRIVIRTDAGVQPGVDPLRHAALTGEEAVAHSRLVEQGVGDGVQAHAASSDERAAAAASTALRAWGLFFQQVEPTLAAGPAQTTTGSAWAMRSKPPRPCSSSRSTTLGPTPFTDGRMALSGAEKRIVHSLRTQAAV